MRHIHLYIPKVIFLIIIIMAATFAISACGAAETATPGVTAPALAATEAPPVEVVELRMTWYTDGNEDVVMRELLDKFEAANPDIKVILDNVAYNTILENLPIQLEAGEGPDLARVTQLGILSKYFLNIKPFVADPAYWEENFGPFLTWMRPPGDTDGIYGMMTQLTVTGPYINRTLFDQAGIAVPSDASDSVTWEEWAEVTKQVAEATGTDFAMTMDRTGHRLAGPMISQGAKFLGEDGFPAIDDEGARKMFQLMLDWHADGTMPMDVWAPILQMVVLYDQGLEKGVERLNLSRTNMQGLMTGVWYPAEPENQWEWLRRAIAAAGAAALSPKTPTTGLDEPS